MSATTRIDWTDRTWNPWTGCTKVSPGCAHCYMFSGQRRWGRDPEIVSRSKTTFHEPLRWREPDFVFTCSWSDWFHPEADAWRAEAWEIIRRTPHLTYQILTKRPELIAARLPADWGEGWPNVWLGVSAEYRRQFVERVELLRQVPAVMRFVSAEPLLGPQPDLDLDGIGWLIAGGESGEGCRPCHPEWLRELGDQCRSAGVEFWLKQLGGHPDKRDHEQAILDGRRWTERPQPAWQPAEQEELALI